MILFIFSILLITFLRYFFNDLFNELAIRPIFTATAINYYFNTRMHNMYRNANSFEKNVHIVFFFLHTNNIRVKKQFQVYAYNSRKKLQVLVRHSKINEIMHFFLYVYIKITFIDLVYDGKNS